MPTHSNPRRTKVALLAAPGGHLTELLALRGAFDGLDHFFILQPTTTLPFTPEGRIYRIAHGLPTARGVAGYLKNFAELSTIFRLERPTVVLTTGSPSAIPAALVAAVTGIGFVYVESAAAVTKPSRTLTAVRHLVGSIFVQWPTLKRELPEAECRGNIFGFSF